MAELREWAVCEVCYTPMPVEGLHVVTDGTTVVYECDECRSWRGMGSEEDSENAREDGVLSPPSSRGGHECSWCRRPVEEDGDTCDEVCYEHYYAHLFVTRNGRNEEFVKLEPEEKPPKPLYMQPWYSTIKEERDYL